MDLQQFPSISYAHQPNFARLVHAVTKQRESGDPITLVCGAGVSLDAGLPSWEKLVLRMCGSLSERREARDLSALLEADAVDEMRKIDYLLRLYPARVLSELVRDGLYPEGRPVLPGNLAGAIARFVASGDAKVRILTTNFDDQLEAALMTYYPDQSIQRYGLLDLNEWRTQRDEADTVSILHLHGLVALDQTIEPIILSESSFLKYGEAVKLLLLEELKDTCAIFVGLSMTDPNLIGPLSQITSMNNQFFIVSLAQRPGPDATELAADPSQAHHKYGLMRDKYLDDQLGLHPIRVKAPSQIQQLFVELTLAVNDPPAYASNDAETSARYGHRLQRGLRYSYRALGLEPDCLPDEDYGGLGISNRLYEALWLSESGPAKLLEDWLAELPDERLTELGVLRHNLVEEGFALFLWLRVCRKEGARESTVPYSLRMIGSSAYVHRQSWSSRITVPVKRGHS